VEALEERGRALGRPFVDTIKGSRHPNMKELRSRGETIRVLFAFDPCRSAILLIGGDRWDRWSEWYAEMIPMADRLLRRALGLAGGRRALMSERRNFRTLRERLEKRLEADPAARERFETERQAMRDALSLSAIREQAGVTQVELAGVLHVTQANISQLERKQDLYLSTLSRYVEALGGRLELQAVFPDRTLRVWVGEGRRRRREAPARPTRILLPDREVDRAVPVVARQSAVADTDQPARPPGYEPLADGGSTSLIKSQRNADLSSSVFGSR
jgi:transcriptional regulator with XRE-family HTH domain